MICMCEVLYINICVGECVFPLRTPACLLTHKGKLKECLLHRDTDTKKQTDTQWPNLPQNGPLHSISEQILQSNTTIAIIRDANQDMANSYIIFVILKPTAVFCLWQLRTPSDQHWDQTTPLQHREPEIRTTSDPLLAVKLIFFKQLVAALAISIAHIDYVNCWKMTKILTMSQAAPVNTGEEGVSAQAVIAKPFPSHTQQTLDKIYKLSAGLGILRKLQITLKGKEKNINMRLHCTYFCKTRKKKKQFIEHGSVLFLGIYSFLLGFTWKFMILFMVLVEVPSVKGDFM